MLVAGYIYYTGAVANPLISLLLLPVIMASLLLTKQWAVTILLMNNIGYALIWFYGQHSHHMSNAFSQHMVGMWLVFMVSSCLIYFIVNALSEATNRQRKLIDQQQQRQTRDEHMMALGLAAADAAHQLNTPLSTLAVLIEDLNESAQQEDEQALAIMQQQIVHCQQITQNMSSQYLQLKSNKLLVVSSFDFIQQLLAKYRLLNPHVQLKVNPSDTDFLRPYFIESHLGLVSAILNVLDNAAKASIDNNQQKVLLNLMVNTKSMQLTIEIIDYGTGIDAKSIKQYGIEPQLNSEQGMGMGLVVSSASIEKVGGRLMLANQPEAGAKVSVWLPILERQTS